MSLLFNMLSRLVITFLPRNKCLLISWLQSQSAVILEPPKIKSDTVSTVSPSISREVMGPDAMILVFWMLSFKPTFSAPALIYFNLMSILLYVLFFVDTLFISNELVIFPCFYWSFICMLLSGRREMGSANYRLWARISQCAKLSLVASHCCMLCK